MRKSVIAAVGAFGRRLGLPGAGTALLLPGAAWAANFKRVPGTEEAKESDPDMILGLVHTNTAFFIAVGVIAVFWFLFGGGRKAKVGRKGH